MNKKSLSHEEYMNSIYKKMGILLERGKNQIHLNLSNSDLIDHAVKLGHGKLSKAGALMVETGKHTGRSANDKYVVKSESTKDTIWWENSINVMTQDDFETLRKDVVEFLNDEKDLYISERSVGSIQEYNIGVATVSTRPSHTLFCNHLFREQLNPFNEQKDFLILHAPDFPVDKTKYNTKSETIITTDFDRKITIITGTFYAGEIKKSMFSVMNYLLPEKNILPMHAGASETNDGNSCLFFGLSGTGKTTLSTDEGTLLIGDDEHGLSDDGVFNFEGGCYAKTAKLSKTGEPEIWDAAHTFGAMLENVVAHPETNEVDFDDVSISENGRCSYPLSFIKDLKQDSKGGIPQHIFFLTADAFGVLPPVSKLTNEQAQFYFVLGYTAKLAGTEIGVTEPQATFSPCFGAPFMLRHPSVYAKLLGEYMTKHNIKCWLVNTGWTEGPYGIGKRFPLSITREIVRSIQNNELNDVETKKDEIFGLNIPSKVRDIDEKHIYPQLSWKEPEAYQNKAKELANSFHTQMKKFGDFYNTNIEGSPTYARN